MGRLARLVRPGGQFQPPRPGAGGGEGQLHFSSADDALRWLYVGSLHSKSVFNNRGLVFAYGVAEPRASWQGVVRGVAVWQIYIDGKRPTSLPDGDDDAVKVRGVGAVPDSSTPHPAPVGPELHLGEEPYDPRNPPG